MPEILYGDWTVEVFDKDAAFSQRFIIAGSDASDGDYPGIPGTGPGTVSGQGWSITMEWNDDAGSGWQPSDIQRKARYTVQDGLVLHLGADDNVEALRDHDFNDMVLRCRCLDPSIHPLHPIVNPFDFTRPETRRKPPDPDRRRPDPDRRKPDPNRPRRGDPKPDPR